jgi:hypothetical protein
MHKMPKKTIYIKDDEEFIYEQAEKLTGKNISRVIVDALRDYIGRITTNEITLAVGPHDKPKNIVFNGVKVAEHKEDAHEYSIYKTASGKFVIAWKLNNVLDYVLVDDMPNIGTILYGTVTGLPYEFGMREQHYIKL